MKFYLSLSVFQYLCDINFIITARQTFNNYLANTNLEAAWKYLANVR